MKQIAMIPARYAATRFPAKLMQMLGSKTVIRHTYDNTIATGLFDEVVVVTDSDIIFNEITQHGGKAVMVSRFLPIVRTYIPFVAGLGAMEPLRFMLFARLLM